MIQHQQGPPKIRCVQMERDGLIFKVASLEACHEMRKFYRLFFTNMVVLVEYPPSGYFKSE